MQIRIRRIHPEAVLPSYAHGPEEDAGLDLPSFFIDTGLEFPETVQYVDEIAKLYHLKLIVEHAQEHAFFGNLSYFNRQFKLQMKQSPRLFRSVANG